MKSDISDLLTRLNHRWSRQDSDHSDHRFDQDRILLSEIFDTYTLSGLYDDYGFFDQDSGLFSGIWSRLKFKVLPEYRDSLSIHSLIENSKLAKIETSRIKAYLPMLIDDQFLNWFYGHSDNMLELIKSIKVLSVRIASIGLDHSFNTKLNHLGSDNLSFYEQQKLFAILHQHLDDAPPTKKEQQHLLLGINALNSCKEKVKLIIAAKQHVGTSLSLSYILQNLERKIDRLINLVYLYLHRDRKSLSVNLERLLQSKVESIDQAQSIRKYLKSKLWMLNKQITMHTGKIGEKYIAESMKQYFSIFQSALIGGFVIAFFASFKILLSRLHFAPFGDYFLQGLNYALCFVMVHMLGGVIATKQPAMTASTFSDKIATKDEGQIKDLIYTVWSSQFIAFLGNLITAFFIAMLISWLYGYWFGQKFLDPSKSNKLLMEINPFRSLSVYYAMIAGVMLAASGLIAGYINNKVVFGRLSERIRLHKGLNRIFHSNTLMNISTYFNNNLGKLISNISLGFMLGFAGLIGYLFGIPFDIRHIAFSAANLGFYAFHQGIVTLEIPFLIGALGVLLIGLTNFMVSFLITIRIASIANNRSFTQAVRTFFSTILGAVIKPHYLFIYPLIKAK